MCGLPCSRSRCFYSLRNLGKYVLKQLDWFLCVFHWSDCAEKTAGLRDVDGGSNGCHCIVLSHIREESLISRWPQNCRCVLKQLCATADLLTRLVFSCMWVSLIFLIKKQPRVHEVHSCVSFCLSCQKSDFSWAAETIRVDNRLRAAHSMYQTFPALQKRSIHSM